MKRILSVASLLNPPAPSVEQQNPLPSPCSTLFTPEASPGIPEMKRPKLCKDEATFVKGRPQIEVNYWPCEGRDGKAEDEHRKYSVFPIGHIAEYCKHVPYRSEKKSLLSKTGREGFHVFQYTFQMPHDDKRQTIMWDYNIGLVRITPFFKALQYPKTTPARMLGKNPGLKEICHNITGGSLAAQGYWMPFEAAKAVAATFCYSIRYVLTPIFGQDFPAQCIPPGSRGFDSMLVAPMIVRKCIKAAQIEHGPGQGLEMKSRPETPSSAGARSWTAANIRPNPLKLDSENGYGTDTDGSDSCIYSPQEPARHRFKLGTPRSSGMPGEYEQSYVRAYAPSQTGSESDFANDCRKRKRKPGRCTDEEDDNLMSDSLEDHLIGTPCEGTGEATRAPSPAKETAAKALLELKMEARVFERKGGAKEWRRASA
ncbi:MAG: hypothetical protein LQ339_001667 [Xanthoria mediterranea]|nr:MAG: hypothetical protein LQ339_001667 [Xanthoria mediterranea]